MPRRRAFPPSTRAPAHLLPEQGARSQSRTCLCQGPAPDWVDALDVGLVGGSIGGKWLLGWRRAQGLQEGSIPGTRGIFGWTAALGGRVLHPWVGTGNYSGPLASSRSLPNMTSGSGGAGSGRGGGGGGGGGGGTKGAFC